MTALLVPAMLQTAEQLDRWVEELGSEDYAIREGATQSLREAGRRAASALAGGLMQPDPELQLRARLLLKEILGGDVVTREFRMGIRYAEEEFETGIVGSYGFRDSAAPTRPPGPADEALDVVHALPFDPVERLFLRAEADRSRGLLKVAGLPRTIDRIAGAVCARAAPQGVEDPFTVKMKLEHAWLGGKYATPVEGWRARQDMEIGRHRAEFEWIRSARQD